MLSAIVALYFMFGLGISIWINADVKWDEDAKLITKICGLALVFVFWGPLIIAGILCGLYRAIEKCFP
jgi:hypothetical protein